MIQSIFRILGFTIVGIILLIGGTFGYFFVKSNINDQSTLKQIPEKVNWIENFYTVNARYPSQAEFKNQFPNFKSKRGYTASGLDNVDGNPAQDFFLSYDLSKERTNAIGTPSRTLSYDGWYDIRPCPRWSTLGLDQPKVTTYVYPPSGLVYSDLNAGEIYFAHSERLKEKIPLLNGLIKPRLFQKSTTDKTIKIIVTSGNDVISYDWMSTELKLKNPEKIGKVPTSCPVSLSH